MKEGLYDEPINYFNGEDILIINKENIEDVVKKFIDTYYINPNVISVTDDMLIFF